MKQIIIISVLLSMIVVSSCTNVEKSFESGVTQTVGDGYLDEGKYQEAAEYFEKAIKEDSDGILHYKLAQAYEKMGKKELAIEQLEKAKERADFLSSEVDKKLKELTEE